jgi:UPF0176 protein
MKEQDLWQVAAFYRFVALSDLEALATELRALGAAHGLCGTILLAPEGVNATVAAPPEALQRWMEAFTALAPFHGIEAKFSTCDFAPFPRFKVRLKKEIVTLRQPQVDPVNHVGEYVEPADWDALINDPDVLVIDTRNDYEVRFGRFKGAIDPGTDHFNQFPAFVRQHLAASKQRKVALYCTGGIRCEKATAFMKQEGFAHVYHLKGGILRYLEEKGTDPDKSWEGDCFVFDHRVAVDGQLEPAAWLPDAATNQPVPLSGDQ